MHTVREFLEPVVLGILVFPDEYLGKILKLCEVSILELLCIKWKTYVSVCRSIISIVLLVFTMIMDIKLLL